MTTETIIYQANSSGVHVIDTIDLPREKAVLYAGQITTSNDISLINFKVVHDGESIGITQQGTSLLDTGIVSISADVVDWVGEISVNLTDVPATIILQKNTFEANNYGEGTRSGKWIKHTEGFALSSNTMVIRQENNNRYETNPGTLFDSILDGDNLLVNPSFTDGTVGWVPHNDAILVDGVVSSNNIYKDNFIYQRITANLGYVYVAGVTGNNGSLVVSTSLTDKNYVDVSLAANVIQKFTPNAVSDVYYTLGHTLNSNTELSNSYLHKVVPFNTYRWDLGTFYFKWANTAVNTVLFEMLTVDGYPREVKVNSSGDVQITENTSVLVVGPQAAGNNQLAFSYEDGFIASLNGNTIVSNLNIEILDNMISLEFITPAIQFSYAPTVISNTELVVLSND